MAVRATSRTALDIGQRNQEHIQDRGKACLNLEGFGHGEYCHELPGRKAHVDRNLDPANHSMHLWQTDCLSLLLHVHHFRRVLARSLGRERCDRHCIEDHRAIDSMSQMEHSTLLEDFHIPDRDHLICRADDPSMCNPDHVIRLVEDKLDPDSRSCSIPVICCQ
jgi:hypothetical protein